MFRYPAIYNYTFIRCTICTYVYKVSVYCLDPLNFRYFFLNLISALLRGLQKMAASKPIS